jgi:hypothetical protein
MQRTGKFQMVQIVGGGISVMSSGEINMKMGRVKGAKCKRTRKKGKGKGRKGEEKEKMGSKRGENAK